MLIPNTHAVRIERPKLFETRISGTAIKIKGIS